MAIEIEHPFIFKNIQMKTRYALIFLLFILYSCKLPQRQQEWQMIWSDEFNYNGLPDVKKWNYDTIGNSYGWGNHEAQWYTVANADNAKVSDGILHISALHRNYHGKQYTSARLTTKNKGDWQYGKIEVRAKVPTGNGTWSAIWMMPSASKYGEWPNSGEIDIMEHIGSEPDTVLSTSHTAAFNHIIGNQESKKYYLPTATTAFHIYTLEWNEKEWRSYVDGVLYFTYSNKNIGSKAWPYNEKFYLILNLAIGGGLGGQKGIDNRLFPHVFEIDYVRVYQKNK